MEKLELNLGQRKKFPKFIENFKALKIEELSDDEEEIIISNKISKEDVAKIFEKKLKNF